MKDEPQGQINEWLKNIKSYKGLEEDAEQTQATSLVWSIWKSRNNKVFKDTRFNINEVLVRARTICKEWIVRNDPAMGEEEGKCRTKLLKNYLVRCEPPPEGYIKVNFDGSVKGRTTSSGFVIRDHNGTMISVGTQHLGETTVCTEEWHKKGNTNGISKTSS